MHGSRQYGGGVLLLWSLSLVTFGSFLYEISRAEHKVGPETEKRREKRRKEEFVRREKAREIGRMERGSVRGGSSSSKKKKKKVVPEMMSMMGNSRRVATVDEGGVLFVEDEEEVEETVIESTETDQEEIVEVEDIEVEDDFEDVDVPFAVIEDVPIFPGCEKVAKSQRRACFQEKMNKHIRKNFRYPEIAQEMGIQGRVYVQFVIAKDGSITSIRMRGPDKNLEKEAKRIISRLPKMTPGKQRGRAVRVPFSIPITFRLQ